SCRSAGRNGSRLVDARGFDIVCGEPMAGIFAFVFRGIDHRSGSHPRLVGVRVGSADPGRGGCSRGRHHEARVRSGRGWLLRGGDPREALEGRNQDRPGARAPRLGNFGEQLLAASKISSFGPGAVISVPSTRRYTAGSRRRPATIRAVDDLRISRVRSLISVAVRGLAVGAYDGSSAVSLL